MGGRGRTLLLWTMLALAGAAVVCGPAAATEMRGVNVHPLWSDRTIAQSDRELDLVRAAGGDTVRIDIAWSTLELAGPGQYDLAYAARLDQFLTHAAARGIRVVATVWTTPCWASSAPDSVKQGCAGAWWDRGVERYPPTDPQAYGAIAGWIAARWGDDLAGIEIWNEPNIQAFFKASDQATAYVPLVRAAYPRVKSAAPDLPVVAGDLVYSDVPFLERLYAAGIAGNYDAISIHPYDEPTFQDVRYSFRDGPPAFHQAMADHGDGGTPVWITEFGAPTCPPSTFRWCTTPEGQAQKVADEFETIRGWSFVDAALVYELRDGGTDPGNFQDNMGLVTNDFTPKPGYDAFTAAMRPPEEPAPPPSAPPPDPPPPDPVVNSDPQPPVPEPAIVPAAQPPPFAGASLRSRTATVRNGIARVLVASASDATGTLRLTSGRRTIGRAPFRLTAGQSQRIAIRLSRTALRTLARRGRMSTLATLTASDADGHAKTTSARLVLR